MGTSRQGLAPQVSGLPVTSAALLGTSLTQGESLIGDFKQQPPSPRWRTLQLGVRQLGCSGCAGIQQQEVLALQRLKVLSSFPAGQQTSGQTQVAPALKSSKTQ